MATVVYKNDVHSPRFIIDSIDKYRDIFINDGIVGFRKLCATKAEQVTIFNTFGSQLGWVQVVDGNNELNYDEDHKYTASKIKEGGRSMPGASDIFIPWHLEHVAWGEYAQVAAAWNMHHYELEIGVGSTGFVDCQKMYEFFNQDEKQFLSKCIIQTPARNDAINAKRRAVVINPNSGLPVIRLNPSNTEKLVEFDGREPTDSESAKFDSVYERTVRSIWTDTSIRLVWNWEKGDLVIPDLFRMAHCVYGGFTPEQRSFWGLWGFNKHTFIGVANAISNQ